MNAVNIVIPMAGEGSRFRQVGYVKPKPFIDVAGKPMIQWVIENLNPPLSSPDNIDVRFHYYIVVRREHDQQWGLADMLQRLIADVHIVYAETLTDGPACSVMLAVNDPTMDHTLPLFIVNSDQFLDWDAQAFWRQRMLNPDISAIITFHRSRELNDTKWSYAAVDETGFVTCVKEKEVISEYATAGLYYWTTTELFLSLCTHMVTQHPEMKVNGEYYVAPLYNLGIQLRQMKITIFSCRRMYGLGVPRDLCLFLEHYVRNKFHVTPKDQAVQPITLIAHRGNMFGPNPERENRPDYIMQALSAGYDVEVDVWYDRDNGWRLGHDAPSYLTGLDFLSQPGLWLHCKNMEALNELTKLHNNNNNNNTPHKLYHDLHYFFHQHDDVTLTSQQVLWTYPDKPLASHNAVAVLFSNELDILSNTELSLRGICSDRVGALRAVQQKQQEQKQQQEKAVAIQGIVFDLDGVLVDSKDLHYDAFNKALKECVGEEWMISRYEHERVYDGLSTKQKLKLLTHYKNLPESKHNLISARKQQCTEVLCGQHIKPDTELVSTLRQLKCMGYPIAVASNCVKTSVHMLLESVGLTPFVDVVLSNEDVTNPKPAPDIYQKAAMALGCDSTARMLIVEDSVKGFEAAVRAGGVLCRVNNPSQVRLPFLISQIRQHNNAESRFHVNVVFPLAKSSLQYWTHGPEQPPSYVPLWLADIDGMSLLERCCTQFSQSPLRIQFIFLVNEAQRKEYSLDSLLPRITNFRTTKIISVHTPQLGAAKTVLLACELIDNQTPLLICDSGHIVEASGNNACDTVSGWMRVLQETRADVLVPLEDRSGRELDQRMSYVAGTLDTSYEKQSILRLETIVEKEVISDYACIGSYLWAHGADFVRAANELSQENQLTHNQYYLSSVIDYQLKNMNISCFGVVLCSKVWSLRSVHEVQEYCHMLMPVSVKRELEKRYSEMRHRWSVKLEEIRILQGDLQLLSPNDADPRRCLAAYTLCHARNWKETQAGSLHQLYQSVQALFADDPQACVTYGIAGNGQPRLHLTYMQLLGFDAYPFHGLPSDYIHVVAAIFLEHLPRFLEINFFNLTVTDRAVILLGVPSSDVNRLRDHVRREMLRIGYPIREPHKNDIIHMTCIRFSKTRHLSPRQVQGLFQVMQDYKSTFFGTLKVDRIDIGDATWRMLDAELSSTHPISLHLF